MCLWAPMGVASSGDAATPITQLIVRYKAPTEGRATTFAASNESARAKRLGARLGVALTFNRPLMERTSVYRLPSAVSRGQAKRMAETLAADPSVESVSIDEPKHALQSVPANDPFYPPNATGPVAQGQWYLRDEQPSAIRANAAWATTTGSSNNVVAVLDTGILFNHPDLNGSVPGGAKLLPGYDFVSDPTIANDGNGRDPDPADPGDFVSSTDVQREPFRGECGVSSSSWHGTAVASVIGALTNNGVGMAGIDQAGRILPVRVLGKCFGSTSDILDAMRWAAGLAVAGVPANPTPARIINLSLGSATPCSAAEQAAVDEVRTRGVIVVAAAGNADPSDPSSYAVSSPANCRGVVAVAGLRHEGDKVGYSSFGSQVAISAPAGNCVSQSGACLYGITTAWNKGATSPGVMDYQAEVGTSFSAPIVAGAMGLMLAVHPNLNGDELLRRMQLTSRRFPVVQDSGTALPECNPSVPLSNRADARCNCTTSTCGAGMLDIASAVSVAPLPHAVITGAVASLSPNQSVNLSGSASTTGSGRTITSYRWSVAPANLLSTTTGPDTVFTASATGGQATVLLEITDSTGQIDTEMVTIDMGPQTAPQLTPSNGGGGGGGAFGVLGAFLLLLAGIGASRNRVLRKD
ncbi:MAG TPA: S8 family peptidase [Burkholderiaceae bacterium]|nr:S8 family peptidase [Burkholderiaceae bacterium]